MTDLLFTRRRWLGQAMAALASSALVPGHAQAATIAARMDVDGGTRRDCEHFLRRVVRGVFAA